jgi:myosin I
VNDIGQTSILSTLLNTARCLRFYLLSPATSYAGDYIWQGDDRSGCERILKDTGIAKEEWQMGVTKAFIKNPETVSGPSHLK